MGTGAVTASSHAGSSSGDGDAIDSLFGLPSGGPNPCGGDASTDCFGEFRSAIRPTAEVEMQIDLPGLAVGAATQGLLSEETTESINDEVADGSVDPSNLHNPNAQLSVPLPSGETAPVTVEEIARMVAGARGFFFDPAGFVVEPGDVVLFSAESPDHAVAAYHERHGRQNRVPDGVGPIASPQIPVGGYWLYRFEKPGVYNGYCPPHQFFGMVFCVVVYDGSGPVPEPSIEQTGRPPVAETFFPDVFGGLDPNIPSSLEALQTDALDPENIVENGPISWDEVVASHRSSGDSE
jgi:plastocyanin